jgi:hypothetical protein
MEGSLYATFGHLLEKMPALRFCEKITWIPTISTMSKSSLWAAFFGCLLAWTLVLASCFFFSPLLGCFVFIKVGRVSSFQTTTKEKGEGGRRGGEKKTKEKKKMKKKKTKRKKTQKKEKKKKIQGKEGLLYLGFLIEQLGTRNPNYMELLLFIFAAKRQCGLSQCDDTKIGNRHRR